jgi:hypothetical protein
VSLHQGDTAADARLQHQLLLADAQPERKPSGFAQSVGRGYVGMGIGVVAILGAIPTDNGAGYALGSAGLVLGGLAWLRSRQAG